MEWKGAEAKGPREMDAAWSDVFWMAALGAQSRVDVN